MGFGYILERVSTLKTSVYTNQTTNSPGGRLGGWYHRSPFEGDTPAIMA